MYVCMTNVGEKLGGILLLIQAHKDGSIVAYNDVFIGRRSLERGQSSRSSI